MEKEKDKQVEEILEEKKHHPILKRIFIVLLLIIAFILLYSFKLIHLELKINEIPVILESLPSSFNGFKITQFSDVHFGRTINETGLEKTVEKINLTNPDIVIFSGDLLDNAVVLSDKNIDFLKNTLSKINAKFKKYAIKGDSDYLNEEKYVEIMTQAGFKILDNQNELIFYEGLDPILIAGIPSMQKQNLKLTEALKNEVANIPYKILIAHEPDVVNYLGDNKVDLTLAGHSLGGYINIPVIGSVLKKPYTGNYQKGIYETNNTKLIVSSGLGTENYNIRFLNPPSINFYRLYNYE